MKTKLIFDIGVHEGQDLDYFLTKEFPVIGVDGDPAMIANASKKFQDRVSSGQLRLINCAVSETDGEADFFISGKTTWSSLNPQISNRNSLLKDTIKIETKTLSTLFRTYGVPYYCKIDIEGYDEICLRGLKGSRLPEFISVETECLAENETSTDERALGTLNQLCALGYRHFKLVDQVTHCVLSPQQRFYGNNSVKELILRKIRPIVSRIKNKYEFLPGSSGPFGEDLAGQWLDFDSAKNTLLFHRRCYFNLKDSTAFGFWCDWHAKT